MSASQSVAVILAVFNEEDHIDACLASLLEQTVVPDQIIVADGGSTDATATKLTEWQSAHPATINIIDNPHRHQAAGLTLAAQSADSEILVRADGHTTFDPTYISASVSALDGRSGVAVGGSQVGSADSGTARFIAAAMTSPLAVGPAPYRHQTEIGLVDTVYLGTFQRADFLELGGYRLLPSGAAEDADFYYRWRDRGWLVEFHPTIRSQYHPRQSFSALFRQFLKYGVAKADMLALHGRLPHLRPLAPAGLIVVVAASAIPGLLAGYWLPLIIVVGAWLLGLTGVALSVDSTPASRLGAAAAAGVMHVSYGFGLIKGLLRSPTRVRSETRTFYPEPE